MKNKRPDIITFICLLAFFSPLQIFIQSFFYAGGLINYKNNLTNLFGPRYFPFIILSSIARFISAIGLWQMKKWGAILYITITIINITTIVFIRTWGFPLVFIAGILIAILFSKYKQMD